MVERGLPLRGHLHGGLGWTSLSLTHAELSHWAGLPSLRLVSWKHLDQDSSAKKTILFLQT